MTARPIWFTACVTAALALSPAAAARPSDPGVVSYAVLGKGSVGNVVGAPMGWESTFTAPFQGFFVDLPACNNWADIGLPEAVLGVILDESDDLYADEQVGRIAREMGFADELSAVLERLGR